MPRRSSWLLLAGLAFWLSGGCPTASFDSALPTGDAGLSRAAPGGGSSTSSAGDAAVGSGAPSTSDGAQDAPTGDCAAPAQAETWRAEVLRLVNLERSAAGLSTVVMNQTLQDQAEEYACELIQYNYFAHVNPVTGSTLRDRAGQSGYQYRVIGENLAAGQQTPLQTMRDWMNSPGHRQNILNPDFTELGIGIRVGGEYGTYWVQEFGLPLR